MQWRCPGAEGGRERKLYTRQKKAQSIAAVGSGKGGAARRLPRPQGVPPGDGSARQLRVCDEVCKVLLAVQIFRTRPARCRRRGWAGGHQARATPSHNLMMDAVVYPYKAKLCLSKTLFIKYLAGNNRLSENYLSTLPITIKNPNL